jgi:glutathione synthase/RimK-type ligase-like ATP-grasp enzyme
MQYILTDGYSFPSAMLLRDELVNLVGEKILVTNNPETLIKNKKALLLIRYGNSEDAHLDTYYNSRNFIYICSNKLETARMCETHGLNCVEFYQNENPTFPCLIRTTLNSSGGKGIIFCNDVETFLTNWKLHYYWTPFIHFKSEYRVHILGGEIAKIFRKNRDENLEPEEFPIRNLHRGYHFSLCNPEKFGELNNLLPKLNAIFGTKCFYGLDIGWTGKEYILIELNSAPGLNELTASLYASYLAKELFGVENES